METPVLVPAEGNLVDEPSSKVDLNTATVTDLTQISGIGPALAGRILAYRSEHGPFLSIEELMAVSGIGEQVFAGAVDRLTLSYPESYPVTSAEDDAFVNLEAPPLEEEWIPPEESLVSSDESLSVEELADLSDIEDIEPVPFADDEIPPEERLDLEAPAPPPVLPSVSQSVPPAAPLPAPQPEPQPAPRPVTPAVPAPASTPAAPPAKRSGLGWLAWVGAVFAGGILGMIFSLLVFSGINGVLNMNDHPAINDLRNQTADLATRQETLRGEVSGLRQRLDRLEGLTARMERIETAVEGLHGDIVDLQTETTALQETLDAVQVQVSELETRTAKAETFFQRLQALLAELFGGAENVSPTPVEEEVQP